MRALQGFFRSAPVLYVEECSSTNTLLKELALGAQAPGTVLIAASQSGGRGRMERSFSSPEGGLYLSMLLSPACTPEKSLSLTPCAAVAVYRALQTLCGIEADIKWPNDLMYKGRKVCGILCESLFFQGRQLLVLGVGLNVSTAMDAFPEELRETAGSLRSLCGCALTPDTAAAELVFRLDEMYSQWQKLPTAFLEEYRQRCISLHRPVSLVRNGSAAPAYALDIDENYALVVERPDGTRERISYGEVSLR